MKVNSNSASLEKIVCDTDFRVFHPIYGAGLMKNRLLSQYVVPVIFSQPIGWQWVNVKQLSCGDVPLIEKPLYQK